MRLRVAEKTRVLQEEQDKLWSWREAPPPCPPEAEECPHSGRAAWMAPPPPAPGPPALGQRDSWGNQAGLAQDWAPLASTARQVAAPPPFHGAGTSSEGEAGKALRPTPPPPAPPHVRPLSATAPQLRWLAGLSGIPRGRDPGQVKGAKKVLDREKGAQRGAEPRGGEPVPQQGLCTERRSQQSPGW